MSEVSVVTSMVPASKATVKNISFKCVDHRTKLEVSGVVTTRKSLSIDDNQIDPIINVDLSPAKSFAMERKSRFLLRGCLATAGS